VFVGMGRAWRNRARAALIRANEALAAKQLDAAKGDKP
jgi:phage shock protein A